MTVYINGTTGYSGPVGTIGDLTTTGNTTLGDASTDTLTLNGNTASIPNGLNFTNGNIGIGVTPSSWTSFTAQQIGTLGSLSLGGSVDDSFVGSNVYYNGNWYFARPTTATYATAYRQTGGQHRWLTSTATGTAGNAITFTQAMTLDASGNLGLGVTPSAWPNKALQIGTYSAIEDGSGGAGGPGIYGNAYEYSSGAYKYLQNYYATLYRSNYAGQHQWFTAPSGTAGNTITFTQAMTLDASGRLIVGGTNYSSTYSAAPLHVTAGNTNAAGIVLMGRSSDNIGDIYITNNAGTTGYAAIEGGSTGLSLSGLGATNVIFGTNGSERARIDSSGNLLVGTTGATSGYKLKVAGGGIYASDNHTFTYANNELNLCGAAQATGDVYVNYRNSATTISNYRFMNGQGTAVYASCVAVAFTPSSDYRIKTDVQDEPVALEKVLALRPVNYVKDGAPVREHGLIAHEVAEIFPDLVGGEGKDAVDDEGDMVIQTVNYMGLTAILVKAIQELKAEFDAYKLTHP